MRYEKLRNLPEAVIAKYCDERTGFPCNGDCDVCCGCFIDFDDEEVNNGNDKNNG